MTPNPLRRIVWVLLATLLVLPACSNDDDGTEARGGGGSPAASGEVAVSAFDFGFDPAEVEVTSGETIAVENTSARTLHTFTVRESGIDVSLGPSTSQEVAIELEPGTYDFFCRFHSSMQGTLVVR